MARDQCAVSVCGVPYAPAGCYLTARNPRPRWAAAATLPTHAPQTQTMVPSVPSIGCGLDPYTPIQKKETNSFGTWFWQYPINTDLCAIKIKMAFATCLIRLDVVCQTEHESIITDDLPPPS
jgi:hypothetical protein